MQTHGEVSGHAVDPTCGTLEIEGNLSERGMTASLTSAGNHLAIMCRSHCTAIAIVT